MVSSFFRAFQISPCCFSLFLFVSALKLLPINLKSALSFSQVAERASGCLL